MESLSNLIDLQDELYENIIEEMDIVQEKFDDQIESYEAITDMIEHDMKFVMGICDRITVLNFGQVLATGLPEEIRNNEEVIAAYLGSDKEG